ncbi:rpsO, partial [Mucuna pruriens]
MALVLHLHLRRRSKTNPSNILFFSTSNSNSPFSSLFRDIRESLKEPSPPPQNTRSPNSSFSAPPNSQQPSTGEILKNLSEFRARTSAPPPHQISFQDLYQRNMQHNPPKSGSSINVESIRESLQNIKAKTPTSPRLSRPSTIGGSGALPESVFGREMRKEGSASSSSSSSTAFLKTYGVEDLGKKLRMLRPEEKGKDWFSVRELNERLVRLRKMEEEQAFSNSREGVGLGGSAILEDLRECLFEMDQNNFDNAKKSSLQFVTCSVLFLYLKQITNCVDFPVQGLSILSHLGGTPTFSLEPPKPHLYFHPDNMSSAEKMKIELAKVRDEFKMSESDCGSARVQIAQLTTKIKHLSASLHKKDVHSRKGLLAMVQRRKRLLKYLRRTDWDSYCFVISKLGLRDNPDHIHKIRSGTAA